MILLAPNIARPCLAAPPGAPTRPARGMSGFCIRQDTASNGDQLLFIVLVRTERVFLVQYEIIFWTPLRFLDTSCKKKSLLKQKNIVLFVYSNIEKPLFVLLINH